MKEVFRQQQAMTEPSEQRFMTNDASIEKIVELLGENSRGLLYFRDELIGLFKRMERSGNEQDRAFLLESWNGDGSHTDDRIGRGTVRTDNLCLSLLGGIQPDKIASFLQGAINNGDNDGFVQRMQMMVYPDQRGQWQYVDKVPDEDAKAQAYQAIEGLAEMEFTCKEGEEKPFLRFAEEAQEVFKAWLTELQTEKLTNEDEHPVLLEHLAKYRSLMPSLALTFYLIEVAGNGDTPLEVNKRAASRAVKWCDYLESHARRIYSLAIDAKQSSAARLAKKIEAGHLGMEFKLRDVQAKKWGLLTKKEIIQEAIDHLIDKDWLREVVPATGNTTGGRPETAITYQVNPKIFSESTK